MRQREAWKLRMGASSGEIAGAARERNRGGVENSDRAGETATRRKRIDASLREAAIALRLCVCQTGEIGGQFETGGWIWGGWIWEWMWGEYGRFAVTTRGARARVSDGPPEQGCCVAQWGW